LGKKDKSKLKKIFPQQKANFIGFVFKASRYKSSRSRVPIQNLFQFNLSFILSKNWLVFTTVFL